MFARWVLGTLTVASVMACGIKPGVGEARPASADALEAAAARAPRTSFAGGVITSKTPLTDTQSVPLGGEGIYAFTAVVPGGDWQVEGHQGVTLRLYLDGVYNQDIVLATGEAPRSYQVMLGQLEPGSHTIRLEREAAYSSAALDRAVLSDCTASVVLPDDPRYPIYAHAPILLGRPDSFRTDVPLVLFYDTQAHGAGQHVTYTYLFTNEDGGTDTRALMARWGRTVDIDWAYALDLDAAGRTAGHEQFQGVAHVTRDFHGKYEDAHPIVRDASTNNNYDDGGTSPLHYRLPPATQLVPAEAPREWVMDQHPWIYALAAKELFREHKAVEDLDNPVPGDPKPLVPDPRRFLYVDFKLTWLGRGVGAGVKLYDYPNVFYSHRGSAGLAVNRSGWVRVAVPLPRAILPSEIEHLELDGIGSGLARVEGVRQVMVLDRDFLPVVYPITWTGSKTLTHDGDHVTFYQSLPATTPTRVGIMN